MKISQDFHLEEFVPKLVFQTFGAKSAWFIDPRLIELVQEIRTNLGRPIHINTWMDRGPQQYRGFRPKNCTVGSTYSQHRRGCAVDIVVDGMGNEEVFEYLCNHWAGYDKFGLTVIENPKMTPGWTHLDLRAKIPGVHPEKMYLIVDPN